MELLDPTLEAQAQSIAWAPRPTALSGKRVALIENTKYNSDRLLERIGEIRVEGHAPLGSIFQPLGRRWRSLGRCRAE